MPTPNQSELIARALILHQSQVLLCLNPTQNFYYLPGGHIEFAEPAAHALTRELHEEAGADIVVGPLLLITENTFSDGRQDHHEINLVFHVEQLDGHRLATTPDQPVVESKEPGIGFEWVDLAAVADLDIRPIQIKAWLASGGRSGPEAESSATAGTAAVGHLTSFEIPVPSIG